MIAAHIYTDSERRTRR